MKICFLLGGFGAGGIGRVTSILANRLSKEPDLDIFTLSYCHQDNVSYILSQTVVQSELYYEPISMKKAMITGGIGKVRTFLKENQIDILIACGALYFPLALLACKKTNCKCICWEHTSSSNNSDHSFQGWCRKYGAKHADLFVVLTKADEKVYREQYHVKRVKQIYNPMSEEVRWREPDLQSQKIVSVGRLCYAKNFELLIDIAQIVLSRNPGWTWEILGEGELRTTLQDKIDRLGLQDKVILKGQVSNIYEHYSEYAMMVLTSRYEGFSMVLQEGMGSGLPLVSFDISTGPNEIIEDNCNGYLIPPFEVSAMVEKIEALIQNPEQRLEFSRNGIKKRMLFELEEITFIWINAFRELM